MPAAPRQVILMTGEGVYTSRGGDMCESEAHRVIRASVLSACLRDSAGTTGNGSHALRLTGARIAGHLDLAGADIDKVLRLKSIRAPRTRVPWFVPFDGS
jgi:hypothetical protein